MILVVTLGQVMYIVEIVCGVYKSKVSLNLLQKQVRCQQDKCPMQKLELSRFPLTSSQFMQNFLTSDGSIWMYPCACRVTK